MIILFMLEFLSTLPQVVSTKAGPRSKAGSRTMIDITRRLFDAVAHHSILVLLPPIRAQNSYAIETEVVVSCFAIAETAILGLHALEIEQRSVQCSNDAGNVETRKMRRLERLKLPPAHRGIALRTFRIGVLPAAIGRLALHDETNRLLQ